MAGMAFEMLRYGRAAASKLVRCQEARLAELVRHARSNSPFYKALYRGLPEEISDLRQLPTVRKPQLMANFDEVVTDPRVGRAELEGFLADPARFGEAYLGRYLVWTTSGTTGHPGVFVHDDFAWTTYALLGMTRGLLRWVGPSGVAAFFLGRRTSAMVALDCGPYVEVAGLARERRVHPRLLRQFRPVISVLSPLEVQVGRLNSEQPQFVGGYPSSLLLLAEEQAAGRLHIKPRLVILSGESVSPSAKQRIAAAFGCPVREMYAASEAFSLAFECEFGWLHVNSDWFILEGVDRDDRPVLPGEQSETVLVTNLANRVMPLIRYDLGDCVTMKPEPCACNCALPAFRVEGRTADLLELPRPSRCFTDSDLASGAHHGHRGDSRRLSRAGCPYRAGSPRGPARGDAEH